MRSKLQAKGTRSAKKLLKKISGREKRFMTWINHNISKAIIDSFDGNKIVLEDLSGIRNKNRGREGKMKLMRWQVRFISIDGGKN